MTFLQRINNKSSVKVFYFWLQLFIHRHSSLNVFILGQYFCSLPENLTGFVLTGDFTFSRENRVLIRDFYLGISGRCNWTVLLRAEGER